MTTLSKRGDFRGHLGAQKISTSFAR